MASQNTVLISQVFNARKTLLELMDAQQYDVSEYSGFSVNEINTMKNNNQLDMILENKPKNRKIYIKFYLNKTVRPDDLQHLLDDLFITDVLTKQDTLMVVVQNEINQTIINTLNHIWESEKIFIIMMPLKRLQFNILEHSLVPPHRVLDEQEKLQIKHKYNLTNDNEFPELSRFDPVACAIGIRPGQVCEIVRPSKTSISMPYYRICI